MRAKPWAVALLMLTSAVTATACDAARPEPGSTGAPPAVAGQTLTVPLGDRPFKLHIPSGYTPAKKLPLLVALHGYTSHAQEAESYFKFTAEADRHGFLYATPEGTQDRRNEQFWAATDACCDFYGKGTDDSAYLGSLLELATASYAVDPARVYLAGHSNGGFMSYRMACDHAGKITAIVSLAGAGFKDTAKCKPSRPLSVLQIHGTADSTISFDGGFNGGQAYPSAADSVAFWRAHNGCTDKADTSTAPMDLDGAVAGAETTVVSHRDGCREGTRADLWPIRGGGHIPALTAEFAPAVTGWLLALARP
jgi:polyhydroxybutyrate depolymerase